MVRSLAGVESRKQVRVAVSVSAHARRCEAVEQETVQSEAVADDRLWVLTVVIQSSGVNLRDGVDGA